MCLPFSQGPAGQRGPLGPVGPSGARVRSIFGHALYSHCVQSLEILKHMFYMRSATYTRPHVWCCLHVLTYVSQNHWATAYKPNVKTHTQADVLQGSPVCCYPCVIVCCFCLGATRKGGTIWTQRPTRTHGECGIVCVERSQINIQWSVLYFLIYLQQLLLWLHGTWKAGCSL